MIICNRCKDTTNKKNLHTIHIGDRNMNLTGSIDLCTECLQIFCNEYNLQLILPADEFEKEKDVLDVLATPKKGALFINEILKKDFK